MEEDVWLVVLEHLGNQLDIHILDVDFLGIISFESRLKENLWLIELTWRLLFKSMTASLSFSYKGPSASPPVCWWDGFAYHIGDDSRKQQILLMLMWTFLFSYQQRIYNRNLNVHWPFFVSWFLVSSRDIYALSPNTGRQQRRRFDSKQNRTHVIRPHHSIPSWLSWSSLHLCTPNTLRIITTPSSSPQVDK